MNSSFWPNRLEIFLVVIIIFITFADTGILLPRLISSYEMPLSAILGLGLLLFLGHLLFLQWVFNYFYTIYQKRKEVTHEKNK